MSIDQLCNIDHMLCYRGYHCKPLAYSFSS